ncbi:MAG: hypothetical protein GY829_07010 [Gammaproteobacteria bacterium]|nr:hypothetical protein [Gammaproteobacteria bacterium]
MKKDYRDICLTIGTVGLITVSALFLVTLITTLKLGKISFIIIVSSLLLISCGMSKQNRQKIKGFLSTKGLF